MDHYSVNKITVVSAELPFTIAMPEKGHNEEGQIEMGPRGKAK